MWAAGRAPTCPNGIRAPCANCPTAWPPPGHRPELARGGEEGSSSVVDGGLVAGVRSRLQLEGAVLHVEVLAEAGAQRVEHASSVPGGERLVGDDDVRREHRRSGRDGPGVQVVDV